MRRVLYLGYFLKAADYRRIRQCLDYVASTYGISKAHQVYSMLRAAWGRGASFEDYFDFGLFKRDMGDNQPGEKDNWAMTAHAYEFQSAMNSKRDREVFRNKIRFLQRFNELVGREFLSAEAPAAKFDAWLQNHESFVAKPVMGAQGYGIRLLDSASFISGQQLRHFLHEHKLGLVEERIQQHHDLNTLNPSSVNTLRIVTVLKEGKVNIVGCILRMGRDSFVDNLSSGGIAVPVDCATGEITGPGISKMPDEKKYYRHPGTGAKLTGFHIPYWREVLQLIQRAGVEVPAVRTVGWDVAITPKGPILVEGNDNWNKRIWQLPCGRGMADVLDEFTGATSPWSIAK